MPDDHHNEESQEDVAQRSASAERFRRWYYALRDFEFRDAYWRFLDHWEEKPRFRWITYATVIAGLAAGAGWVWIHPWWSERTAIAMAQQWITAGRYDRAAESIQRALSVAPGNPVTWKLASELASQKGNKAMAQNYAHYAAEVSNWAPEYITDWAAAAIRADNMDDAAKALAMLSADYLSRSSYALRLQGETDRRAGRLSEAKARFGDALKLDGSCAIDEVALGMVLVSTGDSGDRQQGLDYLEKWVSDRGFGAAALRSLLGDAMGRGDKTGMLKWAKALRKHSGFTMGDAPNWLSALSMVDEKLFLDEVITLEQSYVSDRNLTAALMGWLNQIGRTDETLRWARTLPPNIVSQAPVAVSIAEAMRHAKDWRELQLLTKNVDFGDLQFMSWAYAMVASRELGQEARAAELWTALKAHAESNGAHGLFAANSLYAWGLYDEAVTLLKITSELPGMEFSSLGTLLRHYQVHHDANGQYEALRKLHGLRPNDAQISNNYAFFAALTGKDWSGALRLARENVEREPENITYLSTLAFVLATHGSYTEAQSVLRSVEIRWRENSALAFVRGYILAKTGNKEEAKKVLGTLDLSPQSKDEQTLIQEALE